MTAKKSTKAGKKPLTRRQAEIKAAQLIRGIDNSVARIKKETARITSSASELKKRVIPALSKVEEPKKATSKKAAKKDPAPKAKAAKKAAPKKSAPAKKNGKAPAKSVKAVKAVKMKDPVAGRPTIKEACTVAIKEAGGKMGAADLYKTVTGKYGYWSRQSLYNALKDKKTFKKVGDLYESVARSSSSKGTQDAEANAFVESVTKDSSVSRAV